MMVPQPPRDEDDFGLRVSRRTNIGFLPERDIDLVVLNNMNPASIGNFFYLAVLNHLLSQRFGLNQGVNERIDAAYDQAIAKLSETSKQTIPVNRATVAPFLGYYEGGYRLIFGSGTLQIRIGSPAFPLRDGSCVTTSGLVPCLPCAPDPRLRRCVVDGDRGPRDRPPDGRSRLTTFSRPRAG